jgi:hypothetical protein
LTGPGSKERNRSGHPAEKELHARRNPKQKRDEKREDGNLHTKNTFSQELQTLIHPYIYE